MRQHSRPTTTDRTIKAFALAVAAGLISVAPALAQTPAPVQAGTHPTVLVELFTSEGCSSCPPADALLRQLNNMRTPDGTLVVGLSEHVTYWNRLGWTDPFSSDTWTRRQEAYATRFHLDSAYTPQAVVNGEHELVGSDRPALLHAIQQSSAAGNAAAGNNSAVGTGTAAVPLLHILSTQLSGDTLHLRYAVSASAAPSGAAIYAVIAADATPSHVLRGENAGRTLIHAAVARNLQRLGAISSGPAIRSADIPLNAPGTHADVTPPTLHLVLFAQDAGQGPILSVESALLQRQAAVTVHGQ